MIPLSFLRESLYKIGFKSTEALPVFTVSVGNLSFGGTGKSPFVAKLLAELTQRKIETLFLSRGYGRKEKKAVLYLGAGTIPSAAEIGDEPHMLLRRFPQVKALVHAKRGSLALENWRHFASCRVAVLDDGFQHWSLQRDLDIVLLDLAEPLPHLLGFREGIAALARADVIVFTNAAQASQETYEKWCKLVLAQKRERKLWQKRKFFGDKPVFLQTQMRFSAWQGEGEKPTKAVLLAGIAKPERFGRLVEEQGVSVVERFFLGDHSQLAPAILARALSAASRNNADLVITEKDEARWLGQIPKPYWVLKADLEILPESKGAYTEFLEKLCTCFGPS